VDPGRFGDRWGFQVSGAFVLLGGCRKEIGGFVV
jgi:hypothetical protein